MKSVWTIAGHDPFSGAGIAADIRVGAALDVPMRSVIATLTAQNDEGVLGASAVSYEWFELQWKSLIQAENPGAIKIALVHSFEQIAILKRLLGTVDCPVILDPVLHASSGPALTELGIEDGLRTLFSRVTLLTPNRPEAETLLGRKIDNLEDVRKAASDLRAMGVKNILIKGGHSEGHDVVDYFDDGVRPFTLSSKRQIGKFRGTGCALSSAIACYMAQGYPLREAVVAGHAYVQAAIFNSADGLAVHHLKATSDVGPVGDLYYGEAKVREPFAPIVDRPLGFYVVAPSVDWIRRLAKTGIHTLQLRIKDQSGDVLSKSIREAIQICESHGVRLFINDEWRLALEFKAYGVHLGQEDLDRLNDSDLRILQASGIRLGVSTHSLEEAARAKALRPSYIALGPIRPTTCKSMTFGEQGFERIGEWKLRIPGVPIVAIGGLKCEHAARCLDEGADSVAVISDVTEHVDPEGRVAEWLRFF